MNRREALGRVIVLLARAADVAHAAGWTELELAIESALYDAQRRYRALTDDDSPAQEHEPPPRDRMPSAGRPRLMRSLSTLPEEEFR